MPRRPQPESVPARRSQQCRDRADRAAALVLQVLAGRGLTLGVAESLTGGLLAGRIVAVPGASQVFRGGVITYATELKADLLGVDRDLLARHGPVHPQVATQMARGAQQVLGVNVALATTGVAGPSPQDGQGVGTVYLALAHGPVTWVRHYHLAGSRAQLRRASVDLALALASGALSNR